MPVGKEVRLCGTSGNRHVDPITTFRQGCTDLKDGRAGAVTTPSRPLVPPDNPRQLGSGFPLLAEGGRIDRVSDQAFVRDLRPAGASPLALIRE